MSAARLLARGDRHRRQHELKDLLRLGVLGELAVTLGTSVAGPAVVVVLILAFFVTIMFDADVDKQGGAYATGVLVLMSSAATGAAAGAAAAAGAVIGATGALATGPPTVSSFTWT